MKGTASMIVAAFVALALAPLSQAQEQEPEAVMCPKCETVWVRAPAGGKAKGFTRVGKMACPDCRSAVENIFAGGKLEHSCKICGDLVACKAEQADLNADEEEIAATCQKCETTWVRKSRQLGKGKVYRTEKSMRCEDCEKAARDYLSSGVWKSACEHCGDALSACH